MDGLLTIGEFAAACGLSPKMLRSYAAMGLLAPVAVDRSSGYRYYAEDQVPQARTIALLRRAGVPVDAITAFFASPDADQLDRWEAEIVRTSAERTQALVEARAALARLPVRAAHAEAPTRGATMPTFTAGTATHGGHRAAGPYPADRRARHEHASDHDATNQDAALAAGGLFAVADGIGGLRDGDVASRTALRQLADAFAADRRIAGLLDACRQANRAVWGGGPTEEGDPGTGTTLTAVAVTDDAGPVLVHVGDSRLYHLRRGHLVQLSNDHTVAAELVRCGELPAEAAPGHPHRSVLTRAVGVAERVEIDHASVPAEPGDRLLLCTDGLTKALGANTLREELTRGTPQEAADRLVARAVGQGADDDVTAVVLDVA